MIREETRQGESAHPCARKIPAPALIVGDLLLIAVICLLTMTFYYSMEREIYSERASYLMEISEQLSALTNTISSEQ